MINGLEGIPGSGKSYEAVAFHVLHYLGKGRKVITNLPLITEAIFAINPDYAALLELRYQASPVMGTWDADRMRIDEHGNAHGKAFELFEDGHEEPAPPGTKPFGHVWDFYSTWKDAKGMGPVFIIDECHTMMPKGGIGTDRTTPEVIQWFKLHRHFNADVLLMTQKFRDMNSEIAGLQGMLVRTRKADILGDPNSYIRKVHAGYRGEVIQSEIRPYKPEIFKLYRSHTQGNSIAESLAVDVKPLSVKLAKITKWFWIFTAVAFAAFLVFAFRDRGPTKTAKQASVKVAATGTGVTYRPDWMDQTTAPPASGQVAPAPGAPASAAAAVIDLEPLKDKFVHITGWMKGPKGAVYTFAVSGGGIRQFDLLSADLVAAGYVWRPLAQCMGYLQWQDRVRTVLCDAPKLANGSEGAPVVMDFNSAKRSDGKGESPPAPKHTPS